ncbi:MAG: hypothetical protein ACE5JS_11010 [Nitrospinota bacterium]
MGLMWALGVVVCALLAVSGWRTYDDEGFMLYPSLQLLEGRPLYSEVFTLYGPVFHLANTVLVWMFGPSMLAVRLATVGLAVLSAAFLYAIGLRFLPPLASMIPAMAWLLMASTFLNESLHPGWYAVAVSLASVYVLLRGGTAWTKGRLFAVGLLVGVLAGFKGNVGAFASFGFAAFFLTAFRSPRPVKWVAAAGSVGFLIFLMRAHLWPPAQGIYPYLLVLVVIIVLYRGSPLGTRGSGLRLLAWWLAGVAAGTLAWLGPTLWISGVGPTWEGMVRLPARQPLALFGLLGSLSPYGAVLAALGLWIGLHIGPKRWRPVLFFVVAAGCASSVLIVALPALRGYMSDAGLATIADQMILLLPMCAILASVWIREVPLEFRIAASIVGWQAVFQVFHSYPVPATQVIYATPLVVLLVSACTYAFLGGYGRMEKVSFLSRGDLIVPSRAVAIGGQRGREGQSKVDRDVLSGPFVSKYLGVRSKADMVFSYVALALVAFLAAGVVPLVKEYRRGVPLSAPSARGIRFQPEAAPQLEAVIRYLRKNTAPDEPLFTMPGMPSFYIWTERPSVTTYNVATWGMLMPQMQACVAAALSRVRFLVVNRKSLYWRQTVNPPKFLPYRSTELRDRIFRDYVPLPPEKWLGRKVPEKDLQFEIWVRRGDIQT